MNMQNDHIVYWRKNQAIIIADTNSQLEPDALSNPELDPVWTDIRSAFHMPAPGALPNVDLNHVRTIQYDSRRIYFVDHTPPVQGNADMSGINPTFDVIKQLETVKANSGQSYSAIPNWLHSTVDNTHGCPVSPPFPVGGSKGRGHYKIELPNLPDDLQRAKGENVTVFVLDTLPPIEKIKAAAGK